MKTLADLNATINADEQTAKFAAHFGTKTAIKNLVGVLEIDDRFKGHGKVFSEILGGGLGELVAVKSGVIDLYIDALDKSFKEFTAKNARWRKSGNTQSFPTRVEYLMDRVCFNVNPDGKNSKELGAAMDAIDGEEVLVNVKKALIADGFDDDCEKCNSILTGIIIDLVFFATARYIINEAVNYVPNPIDEGHQQSASSAAHQKTTVVDGEESNKESNKYELMGPIDLANALNDDINDDGAHLWEILDVLMPQLDGASEDVIEDIGNKMKPILSKDFVQDMTSIIGGGAKQLTPEQEFNVNFHKDVFHGMLPESFKGKHIDVESLIDMVATEMADVSIYQLETERDVVVAQYTTLSVLMYTVIGGFEGTGTDVVEFFKFVNDAIKVDGNKDATADFIRKYVGNSIASFQSKMDRLNKVIETEWIGGYVMCRHMIRGAQERRSKSFIRDGVEILKKGLVA